MSVVKTESRKASFGTKKKIKIPSKSRVAVKGSKNFVPSEIELEDDFIINIPPKKSYVVKAKIISIKKAVPTISLDEEILLTN